VSRAEAGSPNCRGGERRRAVKRAPVRYGHIRKGPEGSTGSEAGDRRRWTADPDEVARRAWGELRRMEAAMEGWRGRSGDALQLWEVQYRIREFRLCRPQLGRAPHKGEKGNVRASDNRA
jgi:hypothetical protein